MGQREAPGLEGSPTALGPSQGLLVPSSASPEGPGEKEVLSGVLCVNW